MKLSPENIRKLAEKLGVSLAEADQLEAAASDLDDVLDNLLFVFMEVVLAAKSSAQPDEHAAKMARDLQALLMNMETVQLVNLLTLSLTRLVAAGPQHALSSQAMDKIVKGLLS